MEHTVLNALPYVGGMIEAIKWHEYDLLVIGDGYFPDGTRIHMVRGSMKPQYLANAFVFGYTEYKQARDSKQI